jgi:hypothetical protein
VNLRAIGILLVLVGAIAGCGHPTGAATSGDDGTSLVRACLSQVPGFGGVEARDASDAHLSRRQAIAVARGHDGLFTHGPISALYAEPEDAEARLVAATSEPVWVVAVGGLHIQVDQGPPALTPDSPERTLPPAPYVSTAIMFIVDRTARVTVLTFCR